jgi:hypothetical protein
VTFGRYLSAQKIRDDWIGELARAAAADRRFPWAGEPIDQHDHVSRHMGGDAEALHAFQAALDEWNEGPYSLFAARQARDQVKRDAISAAGAARFAEAHKRDERIALRRKREGRE